MAYYYTNSLFFKHSLILGFNTQSIFPLLIFFLAKEDNDDPKYKLLQENEYKIKLPDQPFYSILYGISNICLAVTYSYT